MGNAMPEREYDPEAAKLAKKQVQEEIPYPKRGSFQTVILGIMAAVGVLVVFEILLPIIGFRAAELGAIMASGLLVWLDRNSHVNAHYRRYEELYSACSARLAAERAMK